MSLIVVNPTHKPKARKAATKKGPNMARKRRSPAQKAATRRMLAANRRHKNPSAPKRRRRVVRHASRKVYTRRRRNPSVGSGSLMNELLSKEGMLMVAAVVGTPTLTELAVTYIMPTASGTTRSVVKAALGAGIAYGVYRYVSKKAGVIVALVSVGSAVSDLINAYMLPSTSSIAASNVVKGYLPQGHGNALGGYSEPGVHRL